jgi:hypothetical protein
MADEQLMAVRQHPVHFVGIAVNYFHFHLGEELQGTIAWGDDSDNPKFFSGPYNDLPDKPQFDDVSWEALRTWDPNSPAASMSGRNIIVDASMNPNDNQARTRCSE